MKWIYYASIFVFLDFKSGAAFQFIHGQSLQQKLMVFSFITVWAAVMESCSYISSVSEHFALIMSL